MVNRNIVTESECKKKKKIIKRYNMTGKWKDASGYKKQFMRNRKVDE